MKLPPPKGRHLWFARSAAAGGDGTEERPLNDLEAALKSLKPGDRLVLKPGSYPGPIVIDESYPAGTAELPIELHARVDAVMGGENHEAPVLTVAQSGWTFHGLEIIGGEESAAALVVRGAKDVVFSHGHFHDGQRDGVHIEPGSERITFADSHIHIFGRRRGPPSSRGESIGLRIAPGTSDIRATTTKIHNIAGPPLKVLTPEEYRGLNPGSKLLPPAKKLALEELEQVTNWPERD